MVPHGNLTARGKNVYYVYKTLGRQGIPRMIERSVCKLGTISRVSAKVVVIIVSFLSYRSY